MDVTLTEDQELFADTTTRFTTSTCPLTTVHELGETNAGPGSKYLRQAAELGWFAVLVPEELGGGSVSGQGVLDAVIAAELRGRLLQPSPFVPMNVVAHTLATAGTDAQRTDVLPAIVGGESVATWAHAGVDGGIDDGASITATTTGDGWTLQGSAILVQDGDEADWVLVTAATDAGPTQFLVPTGADGVAARPQAGHDITRRFSNVAFDGVAVTGADVVGEVGGAEALLAGQIDVAAVLAVAESVGAVDALFEVTLAYAKDRITFGRPIGSFQAIKHMLADASLQVEQCKAVATAAARALQAGKADASEVASIAKAFVGDATVDVAETCWQTFGGIAYTWEHDFHLYLRRLNTDAALYGDPAWHRERICALHEL